MTAKPLSLGLDIGSTTVKAVVLDGETIVYSDYRRHNADVRREVRRLLEDIERAHPHDSLVTAVTGSGGLQVAEIMDVQFVQEVIAATEAVERAHPEADVVIELGGEDAKITYFKPTPEQRMNGTCAGGTGAFIDQMATLLHTDAAGLNALAARLHASSTRSRRAAASSPRPTCSPCSTRAPPTRTSPPPSSRPS